MSIGHSSKTAQLILVIICSITTVLLADKCSDNPCKHGTCRLTDPNYGYKWGYECLCDRGFIGAQCQWDGPVCRNDSVTKCVNNGTCVDNDNGPFCRCPYGNNRTFKFGGHYCELVDPCETCPDNYAICQSVPTRVTGCVCLDARHREMVPSG